MKSQVKVRINTKTTFFLSNAKNSNNIFLMLLCINATLLHSTLGYYLKNAMLSSNFSTHNELNYENYSILGKWL